MYNPYLINSVVINAPVQWLTFENKVDPSYEYQFNPLNMQSVIFIKGMCLSNVLNIFAKTITRG